MAQRDGGDPSWPRAVDIELVQDLSRISSPVDGYLRRYRHRLKTVFDDGHRSDVYVADYVDRDPSKRDATAVAAYVPATSGEVADTIILLRRQVRYGAFVAARRPTTTELIAGLIEDEEAPEVCVVREMWEEAGLEVAPEKIRRLGKPFFILPGIFTERIVPMAVELTGAELALALSEPPPGDGSAHEAGADLLQLTLGEIFERIESEAPADPRALVIDDAKTELVLARLWRVLEGERA